MYIPQQFRMEPEEIRTFLQRYSFGILVSGTDTLTATHLPFVYDSEAKTLLTHMAHANPHWQTLDGISALVTFSGPHAYISPGWYDMPGQVPTWNYVAVHVHGICHVVDSDDELGSLLERMIAFYEPESPLLKQQEEGFYRQLIRGIVGVRVDIADVQGVAKLSQNKPREVRERVTERLREIGAAESSALAACMDLRNGDPIVGNDRG